MGEHDDPAAGGPGTASPVIDPKQEGIAFLLNQAARAIARDLQARLLPYGVTPPQLSVLSCLWEEDGLPATVLAERAGFDAPTTTGILDRLERQELVVRQRSTGDRRVVTAHLTGRGSVLREALPRIAHESNAAALAGFSPAATRELRAALQRIVANLSGRQ